MFIIVIYSWSELIGSTAWPLPAALSLSALALGVSVDKLVVGELVFADDVSVSAFEVMFLLSNPSLPGGLCFHSLTHTVSSFFLFPVGACGDWVRRESGTTAGLCELQVWSRLWGGK